MIVAALGVSATLGAGPADSQADPCEGLRAHRLPDGTVLCTHGGDDRGPFVTADGSPSQPLRVAPVQCYSDGVDGYRVQVLYVHAHGSPNRLDGLAASIRRDVGQVEGMVVDSAAAQGGERHVRWETEATDEGCRVAVTAVGLPRADLTDVMTTVEALADRGYDRRDRRYALYVDDDRYCGIATMPRDDSPGIGNVANRRTGYARVDRSCWNRGDLGEYATMGHELFHTLGAVQPGAPHASSGGHCTEEWDPLCYDDGSGAGVTVRCVSGGGTTDIHHRRLDCGADDYFAVSPRAGSWLATHWNTADSPYLGTQPGLGSGAGPVRDAAARWPAARGSFRPSSTVAGFAGCELPIVVDTRAAVSTGLFGSSVGPDDGLERAARDVIRTVNDVAGLTLLALGDPVDATEPAAGRLLVDRAGDDEPAVRVWSSGGRTTRARVLLPGDRAPVSTSLGPVLEALGLGSVPFGDAVTGRLGGRGSAGTRTALRHLYAGGCDATSRLDVRAPGHPSQLEAVADRTDLDLGGTARTGIALGVQVAAWLRGQAGTAPRAVVCRDDVPADCLAGAALLADGGPLLFVPGGPAGSLPQEVADELAATVEVTGEVLVLGGPAAIAPRVVDQLEAALPGRTVTRLYGADRYATAATIAGVVAPRGADRVLLARGDNPADATAAAALATREALPVLLTANDHLSRPAADYLRSTPSRRVVLLGGQVALTAQVERDVTAITRATRVSGATRTGTAVAIARSPQLWAMTRVDERAAVIGVPGYGEHAWQAALAAAPVGALLDAPVTYLAPDGVPTGAGGAYDTAEFLSGLPVGRAGRVAATSVVVGARLGGLARGVAPRFHALFLPALRERVEVVRD